MIRPDKGQNHSYRPDIDGLRAFAVLPVVTFHAFPSLLKGGFIGVDVFFVISGYLISGIILNDLAQGRFTFSGFYANRIRRLLPALLIVLFASYLFGWLTLNPDQYKQLGKHVAAGAGFVSNFVLLGEAGYFDNAAETKPLLHLWSLGVEEQFYIFWPLLLWAAWKLRFNLIFVMGAIFAASLYLNLAGIESNAVATFYALQTRLWELAFGGIIGLLTTAMATSPETSGNKISRWISKRSETGQRQIFNACSLFGALILTVGYLTINREVNFPGLWAVIPVMGAALLIVGGPTSWVNRTILSHKTLVWFGLISYPLYLWHWPLLSFFRVIAGRPPGVLAALILIALSIALAWLTYHLVERPIRTKRRVRHVIILTALTSAIGYAGYTTFMNGGLNFMNLSGQFFPKAVKLVEDIPAEHETCLKTYGLEKEYIRYCRLSGNTKPSIAIIGDSHGAVLFSGVAKELRARMDEGLLMIGARLFVDVAAYPDGDETEIANYKGGILATKFVASEKSIDTVVMVARGPAYMRPKNKAHFNYYLLDDRTITDKRKIFEIGMRRTLDLMLANGKNIVFVLENPTLTFDPESCQNIFALLPYFKHSCWISKQDYLAEHQEYRDLVHVILKDYPSVLIFDPARYLCDNQTCFAKNGDQLLYGDRNHLTAAGADFLAEYLVDAIIQARK